MLTIKHNNTGSTFIFLNGRFGKYQKVCMVALILIFSYLSIYGTIHKVRSLQATGIKWDYPDSTGKGGTTTNGPVARALLHDSEMPSNYQDIFRKFGIYLSVVIRVMSPKQKIRVENYIQFCTEFYLFLYDSFLKQILRERFEPHLSR